MADKTKIKWTDATWNPILEESRRPHSRRRVTRFVVRTMLGITPRQQEVLDIIERWFREKGRPPSQRHIAAELDIALSSANRMVGCLEEAGRIRRAPRLGFNMIQLLDQKCPHCGGNIDDYVTAANVTERTPTTKRN